MLKKISSALILIAVLILALPTNADTLTIYTYDSFVSKYGPGLKLKEKFEQKYHANVNFVTAPDSILMLNKIKFEGQNTKADLAIGIDNYMLENAEKSNIFIPSNINLNQINPRLAWQDNTFIPYDFGQFAFIYNTKKLTTLPKTLQEIVENPNVNIIYQDPRTSSVGQGLLLWINQIYQDKTAEAWGNLSSHTVTVGTDWSNTYNLFLQGESDAVFSYTTSELYHKLNDNTSQYKALIFDQHPVQIETIAKTKYAKNSELADKFIQFMLEKESQKTIALNNWMLPAIKNNVDENLTPYINIKTLKFKPYSSKDIENMINVWKNSLIAN